LFELAKRNYRDHSDAAVRFVDGLGGVLREDFDIGWGNRLDRQIRDFVPVVVAAGGTLSEAVDHIVCTKLLRKLEHRHNVRASDLKRLRNTLTEKATQLGSMLTKCNSKVTGLIRERDSDESEV
jgi:hypothetical protein